jgi:hypothetical protein
VTEDYAVQSASTSCSPLYQGTASAVPEEAINYQGFSPCCRRGFRRCLLIRRIPRPNLAEEGRVEKPAQASARTRGASLRLAMPPFLAASSRLADARKKAGMAGRRPTPRGRTRGAAQPSGFFMKFRGPQALSNRPGGPPHQGHIRAVTAFPLKRRRREFYRGQFKK